MCIKALLQKLYLVILFNREQIVNYSLWWWKWRRKYRVNLFWTEYFKKKRKQNILSHLQNELFKKEKHKRPQGYDLLLRGPWTICKQTVITWDTHKLLTNTALQTHLNCFIPAAINRHYWISQRLTFKHIQCFCYERCNILIEACTKLISEANTTLHFLSY